ncbi:helix-turn-helix domain-containing protein [Dysosmobacter sp.]|uniref:helix-turn-helix domain-containing protein n=1 Tax=Dysosmobacter sp. TaxID=2591382 RepID=UPI003FD70D13
MKQSTTKNNRLPIFTERFRELQGDRSNTEFADFLGISRQTVGFYCNGDRIPDAYMLRCIAEKCGVSCDYLIGLTATKTPDSNTRQVCEFLNLSEKAISNIQTISKSTGRSDFSLPISEILNKMLENEWFSDLINAVAASVGKGSTDYISALPADQLKKIEKFLIEIEDDLKKEFFDDFFVSFGSEVRSHYINEAKSFLEMIIEKIHFEFELGKDKPLGDRFVDEISDGIATGMLNVDEVRKAILGKNPVRHTKLLITDKE